MAATRNAGELVCGIFELPEDILLRIDMKTLLLSQRVNTTFRSTIEASSQLQQQLFLQSVQPGTIYRCGHRCRFLCRGLHINPLLVDSINLFEPSNDNVANLPKPSFWRSSFYVYFGSYFEPSAVTLCTDAAVRHPEFKITPGSWTNMLMTQPGTSLAFVRRDRYGTLIREVASKETGPQRAGDMLEEYWPPY
ncbi:hypothetical protein LTR56_009483 [Elasticomyces elasticus]|nr:hypothetical protein LTR22_021501 [Elasticomyces elasticus]KAK3644818.1 hypothetical protein LTR56_009483 [Elasticomyces elasticus]KAK4930998.1 hypothetical protein LTR49_002413 [Elasticomyces elasticus]KAK5740327.1 hypothetical protein LTS12_024975 [Elasticomyces elasticus]